MKTVVYQSFRTFDVPDWVSYCMQTVRLWADSQGFDYRFIDDRMFEYAPDWYRNKAFNNILLISDLARLELAREFLDEGYERTIWMDADIVVFCPESFTIDITDNCGFCRELWVAPAGNGRLEGRISINNEVTVFTKNNNFLNFYIQSCKSIVQDSKQLGTLSVGTKFLTAQYEKTPFNLIDQVALFSPILMSRLFHNVKETLSSYQKTYGSPVYAANLCASFRNKTVHDVYMSDALYTRVVDNLVDVNR